MTVATPSLPSNAAPPAPELSDASKARRRVGADEWKHLVARYQQPHRGRAIWQIVNSFGSYVALWVAMYWSLKLSWWCAVPLAVLAAGFLVRVFIIQHDCGHGSFFASRKANDFWGFLGGVMTLTPYHHWRWEHALHHATAGDLDQRGTGDVWTLTVQEYLESSRWKKFAYRLARNPFVLFVLAPLFLFLVLERFPSSKATRRERHSVWWMNGVLLAVAAGMCAIFGVVPFLVLQLTITAVAGCAGVWLFYVQHQFDDAYWERGPDWDYTAAALEGSSFYKLPKVLQWFSGNIGFHHVHHLSPRIPNYNLERCHQSDPLFHGVRPLTLFGSMKLFTLRLWDESTKKLVGYRALRQIRAQREREARERKAQATTQPTR